MHNVLLAALLATLLHTSVDSVTVPPGGIMSLRKNWMQLTLTLVSCTTALLWGDCVCLKHLWFTTSLHIFLHLKLFLSSRGVFHSDSLTRKGRRLHAAQVVCLWILIFLWTNFPDKSALSPSLFPALQRLTILWCRNVNPLLLLTVRYDVSLCYSPQNPHAGRVYIVMFSKGLCLPDFKNNLVEPHSISLHLIYFSIFPIWIHAASQALKNWIQHLGDLSRSGRGFFFLCQ